MPARSPEERALIARIAAGERWGRTADRVAATEKMRAGRRAQFERRALEACPGLTGDELARHADDLQRAHMLRMSLKARQSRRKARDHIAEAEAAETELSDMSGGDAA